MQEPQRLAGSIDAYVEAVCGQCPEDPDSAVEIPGHLPSVQPLPLRVVKRRSCRILPPHLR